MQQLLQLLLQLHEVPGGDQAILGLVQAISGKLYQLVLNKAQHTVGQGQGGVRGTLRYDVKQLTLHLGCCLAKKKMDININLVIPVRSSLKMFPH